MVLRVLGAALFLVGLGIVAGVVYSLYVTYALAYVFGAGHVGRSIHIDFIVVAIAGVAGICSLLAGLKLLRKKSTAI
jgi:hypothetical protein